MVELTEDSSFHLKPYWVLVGTRPEVIKQIPVYFELVKKHGKKQVALIGTGQHRELLLQALAHFKVSLDVNLNLMKEEQTLPSLSSAVIHGLEKLFKMGKPKWLIVQGDTTSAAMAGWCAFLSGVKVAHNEAGLRTDDLQHPFPEEANRKLLGVFADVHFAPTELARTALIKEGIPADKIHVTGNTGIDSLRLSLNSPCPKSITDLVESLHSEGMRPVLVTAHRRENRENMNQWFQALASFLKMNKDLALILPIHPNNLARSAAEEFLAESKQVRLIPPTDYDETCHLLTHCEFVVTDSGGIQEEAATLGCPVVVCRKTTERMEAIHAKIAVLAGTENDAIISAMNWARDQSRARSEASAHTLKSKKFPFTTFGDGFSASRIVELLS